MRRVLGALFAFALLAHVPAQSARLPECPPWQIGQHLQTGSRGGVKQLVRDFINAYNRGDFVRLDDIFPQEPGFEGYWAAPERTWEKGEDRSTLIDYFEERHALNDRLTLTTLRVQRERKERGWAFYFELRRNSDQKRARGFYVGKGGADCSMSVWNMGPPNG